MEKEPSVKKYEQDTSCQPNFDRSCSSSAAIFSRPQKPGGRGPAQLSTLKVHNSELQILDREEEKKVLESRPRPKCFEETRSRSIAVSTRAAPIRRPACRATFERACRGKECGARPLSAYGPVDAEEALDPFRWILFFSLSRCVSLRLPI